MSDNSDGNGGLTLQSIIQSIGKAGTAADTAYAVLREAIVEGALQPGYRLRADDLAKDLGVSKTPVREALRKLEAEGLISAEPRSGLVVSSLSGTQLLEIYYIREALEGMAARLAAETANPLEISILRNAVEDLKRATTTGDKERVRELTTQFWRKIYEASRNERLFRLLLDLQQQARRFGKSTLSLPGRVDEMIETYEGLIRAIEARDADQAERLTRLNRRRTLDLRIAMERDEA